MSEPTDTERLAALTAKIEAAKRVDEAPATLETHHGQVQQGWRMVIELVAGIAIGFGMGYGLDSLFGTMPIFLVLFILLGFAAGIRVMLRTAAELQENEAAGAAKDERD